MSAAAWLKHFQEMKNENGAIQEFKGKYFAAYFKEKWFDLDVISSVHI